MQSASPHLSHPFVTRLNSQALTRERAERQAMVAALEVARSEAAATRAAAQRAAAGRDAEVAEAAARASQLEAQLQVRHAL